MNSEDIKSYPTDCAPSYIPNNLTSNNNMLYFIHNSESQPRIMQINKNYSKLIITLNMLVLLIIMKLTKCYFVKIYF